MQLPRRHQGQCVDTPGVETHECVCLTGRTNGINGFQCTCTGTEFYGIDWSDEINECEPSSPCHKGATCVDGVGIYTCLCPAGYEGRDCQTDVYESITDDPVRNSFDNLHGPGGRLSMRLRARRTGRHSDVDIDECADSPCLNNGTCLNQLSLPVPMSKRISGYVVKNVINFSVSNKMLEVFRL